MKLTKQLLSKIVLGLVALALVAGFTVASATPSVASAQTTPTPTAGATQHQKGTGAKTYKHFSKFKGTPSDRPPKRSLTPPPKP